MVAPVAARVAEGDGSGRGLEDAQAGAVRGAQPVAREHLGGRAEPDRAPVQEEGEGEVGLGEVELVEGDDGGDPLFPEPAEEVEDPRLGRGIEAREGLIEEEHGRLLDNGPGDEHPLLLPTR